MRTRCGTRLVAGPGPNQMACPIRILSVERQGEVPLSVQGGSGGIPRPFEGGIGGPGGHRGEVGIPPAPLAGGASPRRKLPMDGSNSAATHALLFRLCIIVAAKKRAPFLARRAWKGAMIIRFFGESPVGVPRYRCAARLRARRFFFCPACHTTSTMSSTVPT